MKKNIYENGGCKAIFATEENAYETEVYEFDSKKEAVEGLRDILRKQFVEDLSDVENTTHYTSADGYHIIALIVQDEIEEEVELDMIEDEWREPMIEEIEEMMGC